MSRPGSTAALGSMSSMTKPKWRSEGTPLYWRPGCDAFDHLHVYGRRLRPRERSFRTVGAAHGHHAGRVTRIRPGSGRLAPNRPDAISSSPTLRGTANAAVTKASSLSRRGRPPASSPYTSHSVSPSTSTRGTMAELAPRCNAVGFTIVGCALVAVLIRLRVGPVGREHHLPVLGHEPLRPLERPHVVPELPRHGGPGTHEPPGHEARRVRALPLLGDRDRADRHRAHSPPHRRRRPGDQRPDLLLADEPRRPPA